MDKDKPTFIYRDGMTADKEYVEWLSEIKRRFKKCQLKAAIKLNTTNPVMALVLINIKVEDPDKSIQLAVETITGVTVSTFIDDLEGFIRSKYLPVIIMAANEKIRSLTMNLGMPIRLPNPVFGEGEMPQTEGLTQ